MFCSNCGKQLPDGAIFCPECGSRVEMKPSPKETPASEAPVAPPDPIVPVSSVAMAAPSSESSPAQRIREALASPLMLAISILVSISTLFSLFHSLFSPNTIIMILMTIGCWMAFASAKKSNSPEGGLKLLYGSAKANYIIAWVVIGILLIAGIAMLVALPYLGAVMPELDLRIVAINGGYGFSINGDLYASAEISDAIEIIANTVDISSFNDYLSLFRETAILEAAIWQVIVATISISLVISLAFIILFNIFFNRPLYLMIKSVRKSDAENINAISHAKTVRIWCFVLGIFAAIFAILSFMLIPSLAVSAALYIVASVMIKKYFE